MKKWAYYNDNDSYVCAWARNLIRAGLVMDGEVDERPIQEVQPDDLKGFLQHHFFCGILGWPLALKLAGWGDRPVWTGSCPCQPFSSAGQAKGLGDERHLWPAFFRLITELRPAIVLGEQVSGALGRQWLSGIRLDLEGIGYAVGAADLPAASIGAPQIRQRLWWVAQSASDRGRADAGAIRSGEKTRLREAQGEDGRWPEQQIGGASDSGTDGRLARADGGNTSTEGLQRGGQHRQQPKDGGVAGGMGDATGIGSGGRPDTERSREAGKQERAVRGQPVGSSDTSGVGNPEGARLQGTGADEGTKGSRRAAGQSGLSGGGIHFWSDFDLIPCGDGKARRVPEAQPGLQPLATRLPAAMDGLGPVSRVGTLRGAGNSICPPLAAEFIRAVMEMAK